MALIKIADWVAETTNTIGTGDVQLTGQIAGFSPFSEIGNGKVYYTIQEGFDKEVGIGTLDASNSVLKRTQVIATIINNKYSTNATPMNLNGFGEVYCTISSHLINGIIDHIESSEKSISDIEKVLSQITGDLSGFVTHDELASHPASAIPTSSGLSVQESLDSKATKEDIAKSQDEIIGGYIFNGLNGEYVQNGDTVPDGTTHLRVNIGSKPTIVIMSPYASGEVSNLTSSGATIGTETVVFVKNPEQLSSGAIKLSDFFRQNLDWSDDTVNTNRINLALEVCLDKSASLDIDIPLVIPVTGIEQKYRGITFFSCVGGSLRVTKSSTFIPVRDDRYLDGKIEIPFQQRFAPATFLINNGKFHSTLSFSSLLEPATGLKTYFVVGSARAPVGGGDGLTVATGFSQIKMALAKPDCGKIYLLGGYYNKQDSDFDNLTLDRKLVIECLTPDGAVLSCSDKGLTWNDAGGGVYTRTMGLTERIIDKSYSRVEVFRYGTFNDYYELEKVGSAAEVAARPNTWFIDVGTNLVSVHTIDSREPDDNIICFRNVTNPIIGTAGAEIVLKGVTIEGWATGLDLIGVGTLYAHDVHLNYSSTSAADGGLKAKGWRCYTQYCSANRNSNDGFNYHADGTNKADAQEFRNFGFYNGSYVFGTSATNKNASTAHDGCQIVRIDCEYRKSLGPVIADVHSGTKSFNVGLSSSGSTMPNTDNFKPRPYEFTSGAEGWLWECIGFGEWAVMSGPNSKVHLRKCSLDGSLYGAQYFEQF